jgi:hypothetical protein
MDVAGFIMELHSTFNERAEIERDRFGTRSLDKRRRESEKSLPNCSRCEVAHFRGLPNKAPVTEDRKR